jgi:hypothetical protein
MLQRQAVAVMNVGELVVLTIGDFKRSLEFATALELAALMRREARYAKASAGDSAWRHNCAAVLSDLAAESRLQAKRARLPERLNREQISVKAEGQIVRVTFGRTTAGIPYIVAAQIAQWLRLRGKIARNAANESAHWTKLVRPDSLEARP